MAAESRATPAEQMRVRLEIAKRAGIPFPVAWERGWRRVRWPHDTAHRRDWKRALGATRVSWERAYDGDLCPVEGQMTAMELVA
jgi:hypothetical protein